MKRTKSSVSLRNLALSLKKSINLHQNRTQQRSFIPIRNSASTVNLLNYNKPIFSNDEEYLILMNSKKSGFNNPDAVNRQSNFSSVSYTVKSCQQGQGRKQKLLQMTKKYQATKLPNPYPENLMNQPGKVSSMCILQVLQEQHSKLKRKLEQNLTANSLNNYNHHLKQVDSLSAELKQISKKESQFIELQSQLKNRLLFLQEQLSSTQMNFRQDLAQKQYCQEFIQKYQFNSEEQYKEQAKLVMEMVELQYENLHKINKQKHQTQDALQTLENQFKQWKVQENLELKQKRFENKYKETRIQLMKIQQDLDQITDQLIESIKNQNLSEHGIRKVREFICAYFKKYNQLNINHISHAEIADGIDIFLCKQGLIAEFTQFLLEQTQKISFINGLYSLKLTQYCDCLKNMQSLFLNQKKQINQVLTVKFQDKIIFLKEKIQTLTIRRQKNLRRVQDLRQNIEKILAQDSLSIIEFLNKNQNSDLRTCKNEGFFNINQIKYKVKQLKLDQTKRINRVKQIHNRLKVLQNRQIDYFQIQKQKQDIFKQQKQSLDKQIKNWRRKITQLQQIKKGYQLKKNKLQNVIDQAIQKMKVKDQIQTSLKALKVQIQKMRKQKVSDITKKYGETFKQNQTRPFQKLSTLRNTLKSRQNHRLNIIQRTKQIWNQQFENQNAKNSFNKFRQTIQNPNQYQKPCQQLDETALAQFGVTKKYSLANGTYESTAKNQRKTESSSRALREIPSYESNNNMFFSKYNLIESKAIPSKAIPSREIPSKPSHIKKSASTLQFEAFDKKLQPHQDLLLQSKAQSLRTSNKSSKQLKSFKKSSQNTVSKSNLKNSSNRISFKKLSLTENEKNSSLINKQNDEIRRQTSKKSQKPKNPKASSKITNIDSIISNKLLRR